MKTPHGTPESSSGSLPSLLHPDPRGEPKVPVLHSERAHSKISPSKLKNLELCCGFAPDTSQPTHELTTRGTLMHESLETGDDSKLTEDERRMVAACRQFRADFIPGNATHYKEMRLDILDGVWGFADEIALVGSSAYLLDWKTGASDQGDVEFNPAAQAYVFGIFKKWPDLDVVHVAYVYPRREEISTHTYARKDIQMIRLRLETIIARVMNCTPAAYTPVPDNCQWCARKATCTALHKMVLPLATRYAGRHDISLVQPDFSAISRPEDWAKLLPYTSVLEQMADSIKRHALEFREQTGQEIPGYELRSRQGKKKIINADVAYKVASEFGVTHDQFMRCVDVSAKQLTDVVKENASRGDKAKVAGAMESSLRDAGVLESGGETFFLARSRA